MSEKYDSTTGPVVKYRVRDLDGAGRKTDPYLAMKIDNSSWIPVNTVLNVLQRRAEMSFSDGNISYNEKTKGIES